MLWVDIRLSPLAPRNAYEFVWKETKDFVVAEV